MRKGKHIDPRPELPLFASSGSHELVAEGVTQTFLDEGGNEVWALDDFSLTVSGPEIVGIIAPRAAGSRPSFAWWWGWTNRWPAASRSIVKT